MDFHKVIEWLGLEGAPKIIEFQFPCHRRDHQPSDLVLDQVAIAPSNRVLTTSRGGASTVFLGKTLGNLLTKSQIPDAGMNPYMHKWN